MGVFTFATNAGPELPGHSELFGLDPDAERSQWEFEERRATAIIRHLILMSIPTDFLQVRASEERVKLYGRVPDQECREKIILAVGNLSGVGTVEERIEVEQPAAESTFYTVAAGDTLERIAATVYGEADLHPEVFEANRPMLTDAESVFPGQVLRLPAPTTT